jgi:hypothetical protein
MIGNTTQAQSMYLHAAEVDTAQVEEVKALLRKGKTLLEVEALTGVKYSIVLAIRYGKHFKAL